MIRIACLRWREDGRWSRSPSTAHHHVRITINATPPERGLAARDLYLSRRCSCGERLVEVYEVDS